ncbi:MAG: QcrA and Rieske domain-containing protein [Planctomycetota bacterium]|jgi:cytochrome b6-f complex iron-sulfur subunit
MEQTKSSRRDFLGFGLTAIVVSACGGCSQFGPRKPDVIASQVNGTLRLSEADSSTLLKSQVGLLVQSKDSGDKIMVVHIGDGSLFAVSSVCTHKGCDVNYDKKLGHLLCPCHQSEYGLDGQNIKGPATRPLKRHTVRAENSRVVIVL